MSSKQVISNAYVKSTATSDYVIRVLESWNPETVLVEELQKYLKEVGFDASYPHFQGVDIGNVHPFALMLFADVTGNDYPTNVFPSIAISDTSDNDTFGILAEDSSEVEVLELDWTKLKADPQVYISAEGISRVDAAFAAGDQIFGTLKNTYRTHTIDFSIWGENKDVVSKLYDFCTHFIYDLRQTLHTEHNIDIQSEGLSGNRSGDINLDFGMLLHGSSIRVSPTIKKTSLGISLPVGAIDQIIPDGNYVEPGSE